MTALTLPLALLPPDPAVHIRPVQMSDVAALRAACWHEQSDEDSRDHLWYVRRMMEKGRGDAAVIVAADGQTLTGYGQVLIWQGYGEISDLIVSATCRSRGFGTALIQYLVQAARRMGLPCVEIGVAESNPRARQLYELLGFKAAYTLTRDTDTGVEMVYYLQLHFADYLPGTQK